MFSDYRNFYSGSILELVLITLEVILYVTCQKVTQENENQNSSGNQKNVIQGQRSGMEIRHTQQRTYTN